MADAMTKYRLREFKDAVPDAKKYLRNCGIYVPPFRVKHSEENPIFGGSGVTPEGGGYKFEFGRYPTRFMADWFAMHEIGHVLWHYHKPLRSKKFRTHFGKPQPRDYNEMQGEYAWKTVIFGSKAAFTGTFTGKRVRPKGEPSWYGAKAGGEERFCEMIALMYTSGGFIQEAPADLRKLLDICWEEGLSKMGENKD